MRSFLFLLALLPWVNAQSTSSATQASDRTITLQSSGDLRSCDTVNLEWVAFDLAGTRIPFTINYTNNGTGVAVTKAISGVAATVTDASLQVASWKVAVPTTGVYILVGSAQGVDVYPSDPFTVTVSNTSCYQTTSSTPTSTVAPIIATSSRRTSIKSSSTPLGASTTSLTSSGPSQVPASGHSSRVASMVGAILGALIFVALLAAFFFYRRQQSLKARAPANSKPGIPKGHRKWGGLSSVDGAAALEGMPTFPYAGFVNANSRDESVHKSTAEDKTVEKRKPGHEEESPTDEVPTLSPRSYNRYSNGVLNATPPQQASGLAAFNNERARTASLTGASPAPSFVSDPFSDNSPRARGIRSQSVSVPTTAHPSPRSSNRPTLSTTPPQEGPNSLRSNESGWSESLGPHSASGAMRRSTSAAAVIRPARKPVPQYDPSIEMTVTTLGAHSNYSQHSAQNSVTNLTSDSHAGLSSSVDSTSPWLNDRAPTANRNIGLASQGDGPVHYLMPDMPPRPRK